MSEANKKLAIDFLAAIASGELPASMVTEKMTAWTLMSGETPKEKFAGGVKMLSSIFSGTLNYVTDAITAEGDRVVVEVHSEATLPDGEAFSNVNVFIFQMEEGRVAHVAEYMNPFVVQEKIVPHMQALMEK